MASDTPTSWVEATIATATSLWQAFVVPAGLALFTLYKFRATRKDDQVKTAIGVDQDGRKISMTYEQQLQAALLAAGVSEKENVRWLVEEQKRILAQVEADKEEGWRERDRWHQIATHCYWQWRETTGELRQARALATAKGRRLQAANLISDDEIQTWPPLALIPDMDSIVPRQEKP